MNVGAIIIVKFAPVASGSFGSVVFAGCCCPVRLWHRLVYIIMPTVHCLFRSYTLSVMLFYVSHLTYMSSALVSPVLTEARAAVAAAAAAEQETTQFKRFGELSDRIQSQHHRLCVRTSLLFQIIADVHVRRCFHTGSSPPLQTSALVVMRSVR